MNVIRTAMLLAFMTALFMGVGYLIGGSGGMMIAFLIAAGMNFFSYWNADKMVLSMHRAVEVDERNAPEYYAIVRDLAARAGLPMPKTYLIDNPQPNAFATGRNPQNAAVAATTGLLERLSREEVAAVMAHELAHVQHRDTLTMTITATLAGAISMLGNFAFFFGGNRDNNNPLGFIGVLVAMIVAPLAAMLVQMAISRTREYSADRRGAEICGQPLWLASALDKIARDGRTHPQSRRRAQSGDGASLHHQSAVGRAHGQSVLDPSQHGKPHRGAASDGARNGGGVARRRGRSATAARAGARARLARGAETQPMGPQSDRATQRPQGPVVVNDATTRHGRRRPDRGASAAGVAGSAGDVPGLAARKAAAKLLAAVIDARTPLDGLTDHDHGHPNFRALDMRDRAWYGRSWRPRCAIAARSRA